MQNSHGSMHSLLSHQVTILSSGSKVTSHLSFSVYERTVSLQHGRVTCASDMMETRIKQSPTQQNIGMTLRDSSRG